MKLIEGTTLNYKNGLLYMEACSLEDIAEVAGTPLYVYSQAFIKEKFRAYDEALGDIPHLICFGMKANSNLSLLRLLAAMGAGMDLVSGFELQRAQLAGVPPEKMVFSGVGKTEGEIRLAIRKKILMLNVESEMELETISRLASEDNLKAGISIRINPEIDAKTHPYITTGLDENKFGIPFEEAGRLYKKAAQLPGIEIRGLQSHIGSQITDITVFGHALDKLLNVYRKLKADGHDIQYIDLGGGLGIAYGDQPVAGPAEMVATLKEKLKDLPVTLILEPGRSIVGNSGVLLTKVLYNKKNRQKRFILVDAGMTELIRPCLYKAHHEIVPVKQMQEGQDRIEADVAGPVCESSDVLARSVVLPLPRPGDCLAIQSAGAYAASMASRYNSRALPAEVLVDGAEWKVIRERETFEDQVKHEK